jgi:Holliday junction resolvasome RuvABC ATP-dependent DNA helicase subunit
MPYSLVDVYCYFEECVASEMSVNMNETAWQHIQKNTNLLAYMHLIEKNLVYKIN